MKKFEFVVPEESAGTRFDRFLAEKLTDVSRSRIKNVIEEGGATLNGKPAKAGETVRCGDKAVFVLPDARVLSAEPENIPIDIIYEDDCIAVINKPQGMVVHPACGAENGTLVNALLYNLSSLSSINGVIRPGIVHRLDKDTSGLLVVAKNDDAHRELQRQIQKKEAKRYYIALLDGNVKEDNGVINQPVGRSRTDRKKMAVVPDGRSAETHFKVIERFMRYTLCEFELKTGRTHQIRVHASYMRHPVTGDPVYGGSNAFKLNGQLLHAYKLVLTHPATKETMTFTAPLPEYFTAVLDILRKKS